MKQYRYELLFAHVQKPLAFKHRGDRPLSLASSSRSDGEKAAPRSSQQLVRIPSPVVRPTTHSFFSFIHPTLPFHATRPPPARLSASMPASSAPFRHSRLYKARQAASGPVRASRRSACCSWCRWISPLASPIVRSRTPGKTDTTAAAILASQARSAAAAAATIGKARRRLRKASEKERPEAVPFEHRQTGRGGGGGALYWSAGIRKGVRFGPIGVGRRGAVGRKDGKLRDSGDGTKEDQYSVPLRERTESS